MENVFNIVSENYDAADSLADADYTPTSEEILLKISRHTGKDDLSIEACYSYLKDQGFKTVNLGELYFVWLLKTRNPVLSDIE